MANKRLQATITIGGAVASSLTAAFGSVKNQTNQVGSALRNLEGQQRQVTKAIDTFGRMGKNVDGLRERYALLTTQVDRLRSAHTRLKNVEAAKQANLAKRAQYRGQMMDAVALGATVAAPVYQAVQFENAMLGVAKQVEGARDENGKLTAVYYEMGRSIQLLSRQIPMATSDLADMVTAGARMGVAKDELIEFTRTAAMMAEAFELPAGELADSMGKIAGLYKIPIPAIGELADAINWLDDNAISKGGDIIEFLTRTGGAAGAVKITGTEMAALGSTLLTLGETTERASTSVNAMFSKLASSTKGTKKYRQAMADLGLSLEDVQNGMQVDALETMQSVMQAIAKSDPSQHLGFLVDLFGQEHAPKLIKLVTATEELHRQLELVNEEASKGSMSREFSARLETTSAQFQLMKNRVSELAVNIGTVLLPAINSTFGAVAPLFDAMADFARDNPKLTQAIVGTAVALTTLKLATLAGGYAFTFIRGGALQVVGVLAKLRAAAALAAIQMPALAMGVRAVGAAFISTGIGALIAGVAMGGYLIYKHWDGVKAFMVGTFEGIKSGLQPVADTFRAFWDSSEWGRAVLGKVGGVLGTVWDWFTKLVGPVDYSADALGKAGNAGKTFGEFLAAGINIVLTPLQLLIQGITWVNNNIGAALDKAVQFKNAVGGKIGGAMDAARGAAGDAWSGAKSFFGIGDDPSPAGPGGDLPQPAMASGRGGSTYADHSQTTIQVTQQPGESSTDLARRIADEQERRRAIQRRSAMTDGAVTQ